ncbi:CYB protein, partial [Acromyrmex insinuator]
NIGSLLGIFLLIQIIIGLLLSIHYCLNISITFNKIIHIILNVSDSHFFYLYLHIRRNYESIPNKLREVIALTISILILYTLPLIKSKYFTSSSIIISNQLIY